MDLSIEEKYEALQLHCQWLTNGLDEYIRQSQHLADCVHDILTTHKLWGDGGYATNDGTIFHQRGYE
jgi:hypothetical protein